MWYVLPMPQKTYGDLTKQLPGGDLVVGKVEHASRLQVSDESVINLIATFGCKGDWATGQILDGNGRAVHCVFVRKDDADRLAAAVEATDIDRYPGFSSQREFRLDTKGRRSITRALRTLAR